MGYNVVILVGGETTGTRFRPLSINTPKLLFSIGGKSLIEYIIDALIMQLPNEIDNIYLLGFHKDTKKFQGFVDQMNNKFPPTKFNYLSEADSKGTAGGLICFRKEFFKDKGIIFIHGDIICNYTFKELVSFHESKKSDATILGINPLLIVNYMKKYLDAKTNDNPELVEGSIISKFGTIFAKSGHSSIVHYVEKPSNEFTVQFNNRFDILINGGIYIFNENIFNVLTKKDNEVSLELDILRNLPDSNLKFNVFKSNEFWYNLKTPLSALLASNFFNHYPINGSIGPNVSIGKNVVIGKGVRIKNAIIGDNVVIGDNSFIVNAIISNDVKIGKWCRIEGSINENTICNDIVHTHSDGIRSINNIVVLCENTNVLQDTFVFNSIVLPHKDLKFDTKYEIVM